MSRTTSFLTLAALGLAAPLAGQTSQSVGAPATVVILARPLTLNNLSGLDFSSHFASEGRISGSAALWSGDTDAGANISINFTLPPQLTRDEGGDFVPITYGSASALAQNHAVAVSFDPNAGLASFEASSDDGSFFVFLGGGPGIVEAASVFVDLTGRQPGTYRGTITLTVTVL